MRKALKTICAALMCVVMTLTSGCFSYKDMNRVMFFTMGAGALEGDTFYFYGEAFKAYRGEGEKVGQEKRIVMFGKGDSLTAAVEQMRSSVNYPIEYAGNKTFVFCDALAEHGVEDVLDIFTRDQKPSLRIYLIVFDGCVHDLMNVTMEDEQFMGLYLYEMMNAQKGSLGVLTNQYYQFVNNLQTGAGVNVLPLMVLTTVDEQRGSGSAEQSAGSSGSTESSGSGGSSQSSGGGSENEQTSGKDSPTAAPYVMMDGAAVFVGTVMKARLSRSEAEAYKLLKENVVTGLVNAPNPEQEGKTVGYTVLHNKPRFKVWMEDGHVRVDCTLELKVVLLEAEGGFSSSNEMAARLKTGLEDVIAGREEELVEKMRAQDIDILDVQRMLELAHIDAPDDYLSGMRFNIDVDVTIDGLGEIKDTYY